MEKAGKMVDYMVKKKEFYAIKNIAAQKIIFKVFEIAIKSKMQLGDKDIFIIKQKFAKGFTKRILEHQVEKNLQRIIAALSE